MAIIAAVIFTAGLLTAALAVGSQLTGQVAGASPVYKSCRYLDKFKGSYIFAPHESCGIDTRATKQVEELIERAKKVPAPTQEGKIQTIMEERFADVDGGEKYHLQP